MDEHQHETEQRIETPDGVVALFIGKDGRVLASANNFNHGRYGGFSLQEALPRSMTWYGLPPRAISSFQASSQSPSCDANDCKGRN